MNRLLLLIFIVLLSLVEALPIYAQDVIQISFNTYPPAITMGADGNPEGYDIRLLETFLERMHLRPRYVHYPFQRGLSLLESGEIDMMVGVLRRPEREEYLHFVDPPYQVEVSTAFYVRRGHEDRIRRHADLRGLVVGTHIGVRYYPDFDNDETIHKDPVRAGLMNFNRLLAGRVDAVAMNEEVGDYRIFAAGLEKGISKALFVHRGQQAVHVVLSKKSPYAARLAEFNQAMAECMAEGLREKYKAESQGTGSK